ncbi:hypothetical protein ZWY2020_051258 [Hordeum vulgare]|nr:hypothetical protein ZWY2020_051258 [Hordeum vulgare]
MRPSFLSALNRKSSCHCCAPPRRRSSGGHPPLSAPQGVDTGDLTVHRDTQWCCLGGGMLRLELKSMGTSECMELPPPPGLDRSRLPSAAASPPNGNHAGVGTWHLRLAYVQKITTARLLLGPVAMEETPNLLAQTNTRLSLDVCKLAITWVWSG